MNYIALTIGPIYETIKYSKKTRELWAGSYFFSYFMKSLIKLLHEDDIEFILPYVDNKVLNESFEVGIFHDRFIGYSETHSKEELKAILQKRLNENIHETAKFIGSSIQSQEIDKIYYALQSYLQSSFIIATEDELIQSTGKENIIFAIDAILDTMELENSFDFANSAKQFKISENDYSKKTGEPVNPIAKLQYQAQRLKNEIKHSNLTFKTIPDIALASILESKQFEDFDYKDFKENDDIEKYEEFYKQFEKKKDDKDDEDNNFKPHHKYFVVISADGDKMGSTIRNIYNSDKSKITELSKSIYEYITGDKKQNDPSLVELFEEYGGMLIYAGGDDLLGFAPVIGKNQKTFFSLLEELSTRFQKYLSTDVSLSFGVSITYYKYPMIEAINHAQNQLFSVAKAHNNQEKSGSLALSLIKHSGQTYEGVFFLNDNLYMKYKNLFENVLEEKVKLPHNLQHSLKQYESVFTDIFATHKGESYEKLSAFFENVIKDESHDNDAQTALDELKEYIFAFKPANKQLFDTLLSQLAIIKFLRGDR